MSCRLGVDLESFSCFHHSSEDYSSNFHDMGLPAVASRCLPRSNASIWVFQPKRRDASRTFGLRWRRETGPTEDRGCVRENSRIILISAFRNEKTFRDDRDLNPRPWAWLENREIDALDRSATTARFECNFLILHRNKSCFGTKL